MLAQRRAERDQIQANLLELDNSFGKRLLAGAQLTGITKQSWEPAGADLASMWDVFATYSGVVERAADIADGSRRPSGPQLETLTELLTGQSALVTGQAVPLARRQLTGSAQPEERVTLDAAVQRMTAQFNRAAEIAAAAETVWNEVTGRLDTLSGELDHAAELVADLADESLRAELEGVRADLGKMREQLSSDPLALWQNGRVRVDAVDLLLQRVQSAVQQMAELRRLRDDADRRITDIADLVSVAEACEHAGRQRYELAAEKIFASQLPTVPPATAGLARRLAELNALRTAGRLQRLASEIAAIERDATGAAAQWRELDAAASALLDRRAELRGLLDGYLAKARRLGAADDPQLANFFGVARELLWSAPCDLVASAEAVLTFQHAIVAVQRGT
jgi:hypothetical protein